jgi:hypothetical protein
MLLFSLGLATVGTGVLRCLSGGRATTLTMNVKRRLVGESQVLSELHSFRIHKELAHGVS